MRRSVPIDKQDVNNAIKILKWYSEGTPKEMPQIVIECPNNCGEQILRYIHAKVE